MKTIAACALAIVLACVAQPGVAADRAAQIEFKPDEPQGRLTILVEGKEALVYRYGADVDLPHYFPVLSPSGKPLTIEQTDPYPHHRSLWFADTVQLAGQRKASFYAALYTRIDKQNPKSPFRDHIRQVAFVPGPAAGKQGEIGMQLLWEMDEKVPVLDEVRQVRIVALGQGEYFADMKFALTAAYGDVTFLSDATHYAWPFVRIAPEFSVKQGGRITNSEGGVDQAGTQNKPAHWVDYSNTVGGQAEGLTIFSHPDNGYPHLWLTRDYGTFGPRRPDPRSGKPFVLQRGASLEQRVGILVHTGDVAAGHVAQRYQQYVAGKL